MIILAFWLNNLPSI